MSAYKVFPIIISILTKATHGIMYAGQFSDEEPEGWRDKTGT